MGLGFWGLGFFGVDRVHKGSWGLQGSQGFWGLQGFGLGCLASIGSVGPIESRGFRV